MVRNFALSTLFALAACGGSTVSMSARSGAPAAQTAQPGPSRSTALTVTSGVQIARLRVCLRDVQLHPVGGSLDGRDDAEIHTGPMVLDLKGAALDNAQVTTVVNASVKAGTYDDIEFKIHKPSDGESTDAAVREMAAQNASVIVDGTIDGASFTFVTSIEAQQEFPGAIALKDGSNLTLNIDPTGWFGASLATRLDPRIAANQSQIEANIRASFRAYRDDDRDGRPD